MLQVMSATAPRIGDLEVSSFQFDLKIAQFDLSLHLYEEAEGYVGRFEYCTDAVRCRDRGETVVEFPAVAARHRRESPQKISKIPLVAASERHQVLTAWNNTSRDYPKERCLHHLFEKTAKHAASRIAVECAGRSLTYGDLNAKANQLAHHLIKSGAEPESFVGVYLERSLDLVVALLGILKAGAAFVPMDPSFPPARLAYMMDDADISVLVTQSDLLNCRNPPARPSVSTPTGTRFNRNRADPTSAVVDKSGVHHLHLGLDRRTEGRDDRTWLRREFSAGHAAEARLRCA